VSITVIAAYVIGDCWAGRPKRRPSSACGGGGPLAWRRPSTWPTGSSATRTRHPRRCSPCGTSTTP